MNKIFIFTLIVSIIFLGGCSTRGAKVYSKHKNNKTKSYSEEKSNYSNGVDKKSFLHPTMKPYVVRGIRYSPTIVNVGDEFEGNASWYGPDFHGKLTSNGETYDMHDMTAAHKTLPMNTVVKVTNLSNDLATVVRINDRGPFVATRIIDLSKTAARKLKMLGNGTAPVKIEILGFHVNGNKNVPTKSELKKTPQEASIGDFSLQIASFSKIDGALHTQEKHDNTDGYRTIIKDIDTDNGRVFKVFLKGFKSEAEARDYQSSGNFQKAFIVRED